MISNQDFNFQGEDSRSPAPTLKLPSPFTRLQTAEAHVDHQYYTFFLRDMVNLMIIYIEEEIMNN